MWPLNYTLNSQILGGALSLLSLSVFLTPPSSIETAQACLTNHGLTFFTPEDHDYTVSATPRNLRMQSTPGFTSPAFIVFPTSVEQVQSAVKCGFESNLNVSARSGGHSYAAYALYGNITIDMGNLKRITMNKDNTVVVQTGNRLGNVATEIFKQGERALPHGSCPYVGSGGHTLYGGFGWASRSLGGLLIDTVQSAKVVLADGTLVTASADSYQDLFFALRGGGPSFGLVVEWMYLTLPAPKITVNYNITFPHLLDIIEATDAYMAWQDFAAKPAPDVLAMGARFSSSRQPGYVSLMFFGNYYGTYDEAKKVLEDLEKSMGNGGKLKMQALGWIEGLEAYADGSETGLNTSQPDGNDTFFAKSLIVSKPSTKTAISTWIAYLADTGATTDTTWFAQADLYGGDVSKVANNVTAFGHRDAFIVYQLCASSKNNAVYPSDGVQFVNDMLNALDPNPQGAYPNYIDPTLTSDWKRLYFGQNLERLEKIKKDVDPNNVFGFPKGFS